MLSVLITLAIRAAVILAVITFLPELALYVFCGTWLIGLSATYTLRDQRTGKIV